MLLVYYNPNKDSFYLKYTKNYFTDYYSLGKTNDYGHVLVQMYYYDDNKLVSIENFWSYYYKKNELKQGLKVRLINNLINLLNKLKND